MKKIYKRKKTTLASLDQSLPRLPDDEVWIYNTGKLSMNDYHASNKSISNSLIKAMNDPSVSDYAAYRNHIKKDIVREEKKHFDIGAAAHMAILEPDIYADQVVVQPIEIKRRHGKVWDQFSEANADKLILTKNDHMQIDDYVNVIKSNKHAKRLLSGCSSEVSGFRKDPKTGLIVRARADAINHGGKYICDLKFMENVSPASFSKAVVNYKYYLQSYVYKYVFDVQDFIFVCISKTDPSEVAIYVLDGDFELHAKNEFDDAMIKIKNNQQNHRWDSYTTEQDPIRVLAPPQWFINQ